MTEINSAERERQRVAHLVLGQPRPVREVHAKRPPGVDKRTWRASRAALLKEPVRLAPGIEEAVALREEWGGGRGTPETRARAARTQQGAIARLHRSGAIDANQLAAAEEIRSAVDHIRADVALPIASWETRVDAGFRVDLAGHEGWGATLRELAYTRWRDTVAANVGATVPMLLDVIVDDWPYTEAARRYRMSDRRAKTALVAALDHWWVCRRKR